MPKFKISLIYLIGIGSGKFKNEEEAIRFISSTMEEYCANSYDATLKKLRFSVKERDNFGDSFGISVIEEGKYEAHAISRALELRKIINKVYRSLKWRGKLRGARMKYFSHNVIKVEEEKQNE